MVKRGKYGEGGGGFTLVEVLIAVAVFSTGLGGFSLLLMLAIQQTAASGLNTAASGQANSLIESLRVVPGAAVETVVPIDAPSCFEGASCMPDRMAGAVLHDWQQGLKRQLPDGHGLICRDSTPDDGTRDDPRCDANGGNVVKVFWSEPGDHADPFVQTRRVAVPVPLR